MWALSMKDDVQAAQEVETRDLQNQNQSGLQCELKDIPGNQMRLCFK